MTRWGSRPSKKPGYQQFCKKCQKWHKSTAKIFVEHKDYLE